jgi:hypothetical protein
VSDHRLAGAIEKFNRAKQQFDELRVEMEAFFITDPKPHASVGKFEPETWEWVERFQVIKRPPLRFGVILGDCLHNLRSCLDHVIWQVTLLDDGTPDDSTQFPVASKSEEQFEGMADRRIPGLCPKHRAMVKAAQPYHRGDRAHLHPLAMLATLSNTDKHQIVHPTYSFMNVDPGSMLDDLIKDAPPFIRGIWIVTQGARLEQGTPWLRIGWRRREEPPREVKVSGDLTLGIAFGEGGLDALQFSKLAEAVREVMQAFMADFPETEWVD